MHSDLEQAQREEVMKAFKNGHIDILVATDVVSRGIDISDIRLVINFDIPHDPEDTCTVSAAQHEEPTAKDLPSPLSSPKEQSKFQQSNASYSEIRVGL